MLPTDDIFLLHSPVLPATVTADAAPIIRLSIAHPALVTSFKRIQSLPDIGGIEIEFTTTIQSYSRSAPTKQAIDELLQSNPVFAYSSASDQDPKAAALNTTVKGFVTADQELLLIQRVLRFKNVTKASAFRFTDTRTVQNAAKERFFAENNRRDGVGVEFGMDLFKNQRDFSFVDTIHLQYLNSNYATSNAHRISHVDQETHGDLVFTYRETKCSNDLALTMERKLSAQYANRGLELMGTDWNCHGFIAHSSSKFASRAEMRSNQQGRNGHRNGNAHSARHHQEGRHHPQRHWRDRRCDRGRGGWRDRRSDRGGGGWRDRRNGRSENRSNGGRHPQNQPRVQQPPRAQDDDRMYQTTTTEPERNGSGNNSRRTTRRSSSEGTITHSAIQLIRNAQQQHQQSAAEVGEVSSAIRIVIPPTDNHPPAQQKAPETDYLVKLAQKAEKIREQTGVSPTLIIGGGNQDRASRSSGSKSREKTQRRKVQDGSATQRQQNEAGSSGSGHEADLESNTD